MGGSIRIARGFKKPKEYKPIVKKKTLYNDSDESQFIDSDNGPSITTSSIKLELTAKKKNNIKTSKKEMENIFIKSAFDDKRSCRTKKSKILDNDEFLSISK